MQAVPDYHPPRSLWPVFLWSAVALLLFLVGAQLLLKWAGGPPDEDAARSAERTEAYQKLTEENAVQLSSFQWENREKGSVRIPIELAMKLSIEKLSTEAPRPAPTDTDPTEPVVTESAADIEAAEVPTPPNENALEIVEDKEEAQNPKGGQP